MLHSHGRLTDDRSLRPCAGRTPRVPAADARRTADQALQPARRPHRAGDTRLQPTGLAPRHGHEFRPGREDDAVSELLLRVLRSAPVAWRVARESTWKRPAATREAGARVQVAGGWARATQAAVRSRATTKTPPRMSTAATMTRGVTCSPRKSTPANAVSSGTTSCAVPARVAVRPRNAAYHAT